MAKRRRLSYSSDDDFVDASGDLDADDSYQPHAGSSSKKRVVSIEEKSATTRRAKVKRKVARVDEEDASEDEELASRPHTISTHVISEPEPLRKPLLDWFSKVHESRGMPWRKPYDPTLGPEGRSQRAYEVWISEIMLQQTQVVTVIPYYNNWMAKFPTIKDLAASDIDTVNGLWKGLGYYSRAARLLAGAKKVIEELDGCLPDNAKDMESKISGIGRYSAGAICSIAYNQCVPVLDGNVHRLLSRVLALHASPKAKQTLDILWAAATTMVEHSDRPGDLNQALIELGSTVCKVRDPSCVSCPLQKWCKSLQYQNSDGKQTVVNATLTGEADVPDIEELCALCDPLPTPALVTSFPMKAERKKAREELDIVNVIEWRASNPNVRWFLLVRRPDGGLLAGLHEFPTAPNVPVTTSLTAMGEIPHELLSKLLACTPQPYTQNQKQWKGRLETKKGTAAQSKDDLRITGIKPAGDVIHVFSHIRKTYRVQWVLLEGGGDEPPPLIRRIHSADGDVNDTSRPDKARGKVSRTKGKAAADSTPLEAMWKLMDDVANVNIGTGVLKVWKQVSTIFEV